MRPGYDNRLSVSSPSDIVEDFALYSREETKVRRDALFRDNSSSSVDGMSLLQLPPHIQEKVVETGAWPANGLVSSLRLSNDLRDLILATRDTLYKCHKITDDLERHHRGHLQTVSNDTGQVAPTSNNLVLDDSVVSVVAPSASVPSLPAGQDQQYSNQSQLDK